MISFRTVRNRDHVEKLDQALVLGMATGREREEVADDLLQLAQIEPQDVDQAMVHFAALGCVFIGIWLPSLQTDLPSAPKPRLLTATTYSVHAKKPISSPPLKTGETIASSCR
ncbi:MAG: hypothetical protein KDK03_02430 [Rhodobacteraceae bacterium]|nr:hypothetical protein [Paracoccaceae bacterium]